MTDKKCTAEQLKQMFLDDGRTDVSVVDAIEYVHKPMSKDELAKVKQPKPRYMRHTGEEL